METACRYNRWTSICRICMCQEEGLESIFNHKSLAAMITFVTNLQVCKGDGLPGLICRRCNLHLNSAHKFKEQTITSDSAFREYFLQQEIVNEVPIIDVRTIEKQVYTDLEGINNTVSGDENSCSSVGNNDVDTQAHSSECEQEVIGTEIDYVSPAVNFQLDKEVTYALNFVKEEVCKTNIDMFLCKATYHEDLSQSSGSNVTSFEIKGGEKQVLSIGNKLLDNENILNKTVVVKRQRKATHIVLEDILSDWEGAHITEPTQKCQLQVITNNIKVDVIKDQKLKRARAKQLGRAMLRVNNGKPSSVPKDPCTCDICGKTFLGKNNLAQHILFHRNERRFKCTVCSFAFNTKAHLKRHSAAHGRNNTYLLRGDGAYQCHVCKRTFPIKLALVSHLKSHIEKPPPVSQQCNVCGKIFLGQNKLAQHLLTHRTDRPYKCSMCDHTFNFRGHLTRHTLTHTGEKKFQCYVCGKCFARRCQMMSHHRVHTGDKPYKCLVPHCGKSYGQSTNFALHMKRHRGLRPHRCDECDASFLQLVHLRRHKRIHTGERPFVCTLCNKAFGRQHHLAAHMRSHTGERSFTCDICRHSFVHKVSLINHFQNHHNL